LATIPKKPVIALLALTPRSPVSMVGPVFVTVLEPSTAKLDESEPRTDAADTGAQISAIARHNGNDNFKVFII
jgi:hypothetical protein